MNWYKIAQKYHGIVKQITKISPDYLTPLNKEEISGAITSQKYSKLSPIEWAKTIDLSEPINATLFSDGQIIIQDGHHRYLAAKILNKPLNVILQAINAKQEDILELIKIQ